MGIEIRLSRQDHHKVEDFLGTRPRHVDAIWVEAGNVGRQGTVIEQAKSMGIDVLVEPMTERLAAEGYSARTIPYAVEDPIDVQRLARSEAHRGRLIESVMDLQSVATVVTPPHFYASDEPELFLNIELARETAVASGTTVRAVLLGRREFLARPGVVADAAKRYADLGLLEIDLRLSPLGGDDEGVRKVHSAFEIIDAFAREGLTVHLGGQGLIGQTALAMGAVSSFSVGVGMHESTDHTAAMTRQRTPKSGSGKPFGPQPGIWLWGAEISATRRIANFLLSNKDIRSRLACQIGDCATDVLNPLRDAKTHYLHSRTAGIEALASQPSTWRLANEESRLRRAQEMRAIVNSLLPEELDERPVHSMKTRTLKSLISEIGWRQQSRSA